MYNCLIALVDNIPTHTNTSCIYWICLYRNIVLMSSAFVINNKVGGCEITEIKLELQNPQ